MRVPKLLFLGFILGFAVCWDPDPKNYTNWLRREDFSLEKRYKIEGNPDAGKFQDIVVADNLLKPVNLCFAPDGRIFVVCKGGTIRVLQPDGTLDPNPWIDITPSVHDMADRGLLSCAFHPEFPAKPFVFLIYVVNPEYGVPNINADTATQGVVVRYQEVNGRADMNSAFFLIGKEKGTGFPCCSNSHLVGEVAFGNDGTLLVSGGDGAHWEWVDYGQNTIEQDPQCEQYFGNDMDVGIRRSQMFNNIGGKILRIDPETGNGIGPDTHPGLVPNPFYDADNPGSPKSRIWAYGFRNNFRFVVRKDGNVDGPGVLYVADVGWYTWEELHVVRQGGTSCGWPCVSGNNIIDPDYNDANKYPIIAAWCADNLKNVQHTPPLLYWNHWTPDWAGFTGNCVAGGVPYFGERYPERYRGESNHRAVFFADYGQQWIRVLWVDENDNFLENEGIQEFMFGIGPITALKPDPVSGDLFYVTITGSVHRIVWPTPAVVNHPPQAKIDAFPTVGYIQKDGPLKVFFSADDSYDIDQDPFSCFWDFGDGTTSNSCNVVHSYLNAGKYTATLTVMDNKYAYSSAQISIIGNEASPKVTITSPTNNFVFSTNLGQQMTRFAADVTDEDTPANKLQWRWEIRVIHNNHFHADAMTTNDKTWAIDLATMVSKLERNSLEIRLVVVDDYGNTGSDMIRIRPQDMNNAPPTAAMTVAPAYGTADLIIVADTTSSKDPDEDMLYRSIDWGDGFIDPPTITTIRKHIYSQPGDYLLKLTVEDVFGVKSTTNYIAVHVDARPQPILLGYWPFNRVNANDTTTDCSSNGYNAQVSNGVTLSLVGFRGSAFAFNGNAQQIIKVDGFALQQANDVLAISLYVKLTQNYMPDFPTLVSSKRSWESPDGFELQYVASQGLNSIRMIGGAAAPNDNNFCEAAHLAIQDGNWHQIIVTTNGKYCTIFVDGRDMTSDGSISPILNTNNQLWIGANPGVDGNGANAFIGMLDELAIWGSFLYPAEVINLAGNLIDCYVNSIPTSAGTTTSISTTPISTTSISTTSVSTTSVVTGTPTATSSSTSLSSNVGTGSTTNQATVNATSTEPTSITPTDNQRKPATNNAPQSVCITVLLPTITLITMLII